MIFVFLAAVIFLCEHSISFSSRGTSDFNPSEDDITTAVADGSPVRRFALISLGLFAIASLIRHRRDGHLRSDGPLGWVLLGFATWAFVSPIWAEDLALTLRRLAVFAIVCVAALAVTRCLSLREIVLWTFFKSAVFLVTGVLAEMFLGTFHPFAYGYRFAGTLHPNNQGINCALLLLSGLAAADLEENASGFFRACAALGVAFLIFTASRTSFAAALLAIAVYLAVVCSRRIKAAIVFALAVGLCVLLLVLGDAFLPKLKNAMMLGRDDDSVDSFNGRTGIWEDAGRYVALHPLTGFGFGGFWTPAHIEEISRLENWGTGEGHSSYLDCLLNLGLVGLVTLAITLLGGIGCSFRAYRSSRDPAFAFTGALLVFCAINGFLESAIFDLASLTFLCATVLMQVGFRASRVDDVLERRRFIQKPVGVLL